MKWQADVRNVKENTLKRLVFYALENSLRVGPVINRPKAAGPSLAFTILTIWMEKFQSCQFLQDCKPHANEQKTGMTKSNFKMD